MAECSFIDPIFLVAQDVLAGCSALAQSKYLERHNAALKVLFFEMARDLRLIDSVPPWYSCAVPKPVYESSEALAFWDVPVYAEHTIVKANRVDARFVDHKNKKVWAVEKEEKTVKYGPLRFELKKQYPGYDVEQCSIIIDVLGGGGVVKGCRPDNEEALWQ